MEIRLKQIVNGGAGAVDADARALVYSCADSIGIAYKKKTCKSCVIDLAVLCLQAMAKQNSQELKLKDGVDIIVNGQRCCIATCDTPEKCKLFLKMGTPRRYFENASK